MEDDGYQLISRWKTRLQNEGGNDEVAGIVEDDNKEAGDEGKGGNRTGTEG